MAPTGPSPRAPGETLSLVRWTRQRQRLIAVPFLKALLGLHLESLMWQLEMVASPVFRRGLMVMRCCDEDFSIERGRPGRYVCRRRHVQDDGFTSSGWVLPSTCRLLGTYGWKVRWPGQPWRCSLLRRRLATAVTRP